MGVLQTIEIGKLLVLGDASDRRLSQSCRISRVVEKVKPCPACLHGTIYERDKLRGSNIRALILSNWSASRPAQLALNAIRERQPKLPILVLGEADENSRIAAYEAGADDYASSSCSDRELSAHVRGLLRRFEPVEDAVAVSDLKVWTNARVAFRSGLPIKLSNKEMELLLYLLANRSTPVSRMDILRNVFGVASDPGTNVVEVHIHRVRQKIDAGRKRKLLKTIRGVGYVLGSEEGAPRESRDMPEGAVG